MTEAEWLACSVGQEDTGEMHDYLCGKGSPRRLRLFACACCRHVAAAMSDPRSRRAVDVAESYADGAAGREELRAAWREADQAAGGLLVGPEEGSDPRPYHAALAAHWSAIPPARDDDYHAAESASHSAFYAQRAADPSAEPAAQGRLLCDIFGRPLSLPRADPGWLTLPVQALAKAAYEERALPSGELDPARLAILSDALEEAGCADEDVLGHLRSPGPHVRGCWALDLVLGKE